MQLCLKKRVSQFHRDLLFRKERSFTTFISSRWDHYPRNLSGSPYPPVTDRVTLEYLWSYSFLTCTIIDEGWSLVLVTPVEKVSEEISTEVENDTDDKVSTEVDGYEDVDVDESENKSRARLYPNDIKDLP